MKAWELLSDPKKWTQGANARLASGSVVHWPYPKNTSCWCAAGAIFWCYPDDCGMYDLACDVARKLFDLPLEKVNDDLGYDAVIQVLKEADV